MNYPDRVSRAGISIYDVVRENGSLFLPTDELERILRRDLLGLNLDLPLRTRSKVVKARICEILGYPVPPAFKRTRPRFLGQDFDVYVQKSDNLQIWNEEVSPTRRYVVIRLDACSVVSAVRVVTGEHLARLDTTGTLTSKYQAKSRARIEDSQLVTRSDPYGLIEELRRAADGRFAKLLPITELYERLRSIVGMRFENPGTDQERNRGAYLHRAVCSALGVPESRDTGACPDILEQLLEIKLQTAPTIDLGLVSPDDTSPIDAMPRVRHCDVRYAVFYGSIESGAVRIEHMVLSSGSDFFSFFHRFEGRIVNTKIQLRLPSDFFG